MMYTTPRKVKQESRLRRTHSLTNNNNQALIIMMDESNNSAETFEGGKIYGSYEGSSDPSSPFPNQNLPGAFEADTSTTQQQSSSLQQLTSGTGTRNGNSDSSVYCSNHSRLTWDDENYTLKYRTHSPKFPIVEEVTLTTSQELSPTRKNSQLCSLGTRNKLGEKILTNHIPEFGLVDERKALTLDSRTGREIQQKLFSNTARTITRRNSLDLEKFIKVFNEEQILMSSFQGRNSAESSGGIENSNMDPKMYSCYNNGKNGMGYYNDSTSSSNSLSLSSSTSNTDSLDTVIYKTPVSSHPTTIGSTREWREQMFTESSTAIQMEHHAPGPDNNGYRDANNQFMDHRQTQQGMSYPMSQFAGHNEHGLEYRSAKSQLQNSSSQQPVHHPSYQNSHNNGPPPTNSGIGLMRTGNGSNNAMNPSGHSQAHQSISTNGSVGVHQQQQFPNNPDLHGLEKGKDSTKLFHTKTYNNIKGMISSRFGNSNNGTKGVLSSASGASNHKNNASAEGEFNNSGVVESNGGNLGLPTAPYTTTTHHHHNHNNGGNAGYALQVTSNGHGPPYYVVPQNASSPGTYNGGQYPGNSYKSPQMSDRKDVNTSFRKAIQQSTQKSNLIEDSVQIRSAMDPQNHHMQPPVQNGSGGGQFYGGPVNSSEFNTGAQNGGHVERAQRALDRLLDVEPNCHESSKVQSLASGYNNRMTQFQRTEDPKSGTRSNLSHSYQPNNNGIHQSIPNPVLTSTKNVRVKSNGDLTLPVISYPLKSQQTNAHVHPTFPDISKLTTTDQPPLLPSTQHPTVHQNHQVAPLGLPSVPLVRENGDGSSVSVEGASKCPNSNGIDGILTSGHGPLQVIPLSPGTENVSSSSECEVKGSQRVGSGQSHTTTDSGHGTLLTKSPLHSGNGNEKMDGLMLGHHSKFNDHLADSISSGNDSEWVDIVEPEIRQILEIERLKKSGKGSLGRGEVPGPSSQQQNPGTFAQSSRRSNVTTTNDANNSSLGPNPEKPPPHKESLHHDHDSPKHSKKFDLSSCNNKKSSHDASVPGPSSGQGPSSSKPTKSPKCPTSLLRSNSGSDQRPNPWSSTGTMSRQRLLLNDKGKSATIGRKDLIGQTKAGKLTRNAMSQILYSLHDDGGDMTSTTNGLDLDSILDGRTENTSEDDDQSTTIDTTDAQAIRRQLESLESMYTEVLKVLGGKKQVPGLRYPPPPTSDLRTARRRPFGSMSSLPSSVSSRPFRESRKRMEDKKKVKDIKSINRRFQRLEAHVVTLARSVAHLSSEMRTQHLMVQEMESVRNELVQLRNQVVKSAVQNQSGAATGVAGRGANGRQGVQSNDWTSFRNALPSLTNPCRVRKLTKFFGDEPPLIRIFLKKLGYEKYAFHFEQERIGIMELPYLTEERLQKMGIPMGPRLRILQEAHLCLRPGAQFTVDHQHLNGNAGNLSVYLV